MIRPALFSIAIVAAMSGAAAAQNARDEELFAEVKKFPEVMRAVVVTGFALGVYVDPGKSDPRAVADKVCALLKKQRPEFRWVTVNDGPLYKEKRLNKTLAPVQCP